MHKNAKSNEYAQILGDLLDVASKSVIAAVLVSILNIEKGEDDLDSGYIQARFIGEWRILHQNGIVPQKPPEQSVKNS